MDDSSTNLQAAAARASGQRLLGGVLALALVVCGWRLRAEVVWDNLGAQHSAAFQSRGDATQLWAAQQFHCGLATHVTRLDLNLHQFGGDGTFFVKICASDAAGLPGAVVAGGELATRQHIDNLGLSPTNVFSLTNLSLNLQSNHSYFVVVGREAGKIGSGEFSWGYTSETAAETLYTVSFDGGKTWANGQTNSPQRMRIEAERPTWLEFRHAPGPQVLHPFSILQLTNDAVRFDGNGLGLQYELLAAPAGMSIDAAGVIRWTPGVQSAPSTNEVFTLVADGDFRLTNQFRVTVLSPPPGTSNFPPVFDNLADQFVDEGTALMTPIYAHDPDGLAASLGYELVSGPPGLSLSPEGLLFWMPEEVDGPGEYTVTVRVVDQGLPPLSATNQFRIHVREVNQPPTLGNMADTAIDELATLAVSNPAVDTDLPQQSLSYHFLKSPAGATIDSQGFITWAAPEGVGGTTNEFVTVATDGMATTTNRFLVVVRKVNQPPELYVPEDLTLLPDQPWQLQLKATDRDLPPDPFTFRLLSAPPGLVIDATNGWLNWRPTQAQCPSTNQVIVAIADPTTPSLGDTQTFNIYVRSPQPPVLVDNLTSSRYGDFAFPDHDAAVRSAQGFNSGPATWLTAVRLNLHRLGAGAGRYSVWLYDAATNGVPGRMVAELAASSAVAELGESADNLWTRRELALPLTPFSEYFLVVGYADNTGEGLAWSYGESNQLGSAFNQTDNQGFSWQPADLEYPQRLRVEASLNTAPTFSLATNILSGELTPLNVVLSATDQESAPNQLTWELLSGPVGAILNSTNGMLAWTPNEAQGPSTNLVMVRVTDNGVPSLSTTGQFSVVIIETNSAPQLTVPVSSSVNELTEYVGLATALDSDLPAQSLTYSLTAAPPGMIIDPRTGQIRWTPSEQQGPATHIVTVRVEDDGSPRMADSRSFNIAVKEVNLPPTIIPPSGSTILAGAFYSAWLQASDPDWPANTLTFSLVKGPNGMTVSSLGLLQWQTTAASGPSTNLISLRVTDNGRPAMSATNSYVLIVRAGASSPRLPAIPDQTVDELTELVVTNAALEAVTSAGPLFYELLHSPPGASIDATGVVRWRPSEAQGPSTNTLITKVSNGADAATNQFTVIVNEVNQAPEAAMIADQVVGEFETFSLAVTAHDPDLPLQALSYRLLKSPSAAVVDSNGVIRWTPSEVDGPSTNLFVVAVSDGDIAVTNSFVVQVRESNRPPELAVPVINPIYPGELLRMQLAASDSDWPSQLLDFHLLTGPDGLSISVDGDLSWIPSESQVGTNLVSLRVTDGSATIEANLMMEVFPKPTLRFSSMGDGSVVLFWNSICGRAYLVEHKEEVNDSQWQPLVESVVATGPSTAWTNRIAGSYGCYRLIALPQSARQQ